MPPLKTLESAELIKKHHIESQAPNRPTAAGSSSASVPSTSDNCLDFWLSSQLCWLSAMDSYGPIQHWPYPSQSKRDSSEPDYDGTQPSDEESPMKRGPSPSWLDGWDDFQYDTFLKDIPASATDICIYNFYSSNNVNSSPGVTVALRLLQEISNMSSKEWEATSTCPIIFNHM